jgi:hypothetical protein
MTSTGMTERSQLTRIALPPRASEQSRRPYDVLSVGIVIVHIRAPTEPSQRIYPSATSNWWVVDTTKASSDGTFFMSRLRHFLTDSDLVVVPLGQYHRA